MTIAALTKGQFGMTHQVMADIADWVVASDIWNGLSGHAHFDDSKFNLATRWMHSLVLNMRGSGWTSCDRELWYLRKTCQQRNLGYSIHALHDFFSHSSYVEKYGTRTNTDESKALLNSMSESSGSMSDPPSSFRPCEKRRWEISDTSHVVSGRFKLFQSESWHCSDDPLPDGQCLHGFRDQENDKGEDVACKGINKDLISMREYPEPDYHYVNVRSFVNAVNLAHYHTQKFVEKVLAMLSKSQTDDLFDGDKIRRKADPRTNRTIPLRYDIEESVPSINEELEIHFVLVQECSEAFPTTSDLRVEFRPVDGSETVIGSNLKRLPREESCVEIHGEESKASWWTTVVQFNTPLPHSEHVIRQDQDREISFLNEDNLLHLTCLNMKQNINYADNVPVVVVENACDFSVDVRFSALDAGVILYPTRAILESGEWTEIVVEGRPVQDTLKNTVVVETRFSGTGEIANTLNVALLFPSEMEESTITVASSIVIPIVVSGIILMIGALISAMVVLYCCYRRRRKKRSESSEYSEMKEEIVEDK